MCELEKLGFLISKNIRMIHTATWKNLYVAKNKLKIYNSTWNNVKRIAWAIYTWCLIMMYPPPFSNTRFKIGREQIKHTML